MIVTIVRHRLGAVLLEVVVALAILGLSGVSLLRLAAAGLSTMQTAGDRAAAIERGSAFLDDVALWPREELDRHLGRRAEGEFVLEIQRPSPMLYSASVSAALGAPLVNTILYRRASE